MSKCTITSVSVQAHPGCTEDEAKEHAILLCLDFDAPIHLHFQGRTGVVTPDSLFDCITLEEPIT